MCTAGGASHKAMTKSRRFLARGRLPVGALASISATFGLIIWALVANAGGGSRGPVYYSQGGAAPAANANTTGPIALSPGGLRAASRALKQPVYWVGARPDVTYELTVRSDAKVYVRYLPPGIPAGDSRAFLTVATYPLQDAFVVTQGIAQRGVALHVGPKAVAFQPQNDSVRAYVAFENTDDQIEVYSPTAGEAATLVEEGLVTKVTPG